tara:strand:- start:1130 stop:3010 length:1881 start_codon:yes stop_codon:yes gene_type:complete
LAKVLPAGANVDLNLGDDPMDRLVQTVDLAMKVGGAYQKAQDRRRTASSNEMTDLLTMLTNGSRYLSGDDYQKIGNQIKNATSNARGIGTPTLSTQADLLENVHESLALSNTEYENSLLTFNNDFMNIDIFNQSNYTAADGKSVNMEFLDEINNKGIDWFNDTQAQLSNYQMKLFDVNANGQLVPKKDNQASRKAMADYQKAQNMFYNLYDSRLNNVISEEEYIYIAQNGGLTNEALDNYRQVVLDNATNRLNTLERSIASNNKLTSSLKMKKTDKLRVALKDTDDGENAWILNYLEENQDITEAELNQALEYTPEEYENGIFLGPSGEVEDMPEKIKRVYDSLIAEANNTSISLNAEYDDLKDRFDFWSPFTWDSKNSASIVDPGSGSGIKLKDNNNKETPILDEDGDGMSDYIQRPVEEETPEKEEAPVEDKKPLFKLENKEDFVKLGINVPDNLTESDLKRIEKELLDISNNMGDSDTNFVKMQSISRATFAINNALGNPQPDSEKPTVKTNLNESQLSQATPQFERWQKRLRNEIAVAKRNIDEKTKQMNQMTSFNKQSLQNQKNKLSLEIKALQDALAQKQNLLDTTDINVWINTIASDRVIEQIKTGKSGAQLVQDYLNK